jgi:hypothetical protein
MLQLTSRAFSVVLLFCVPLAGGAAEPTQISDDARRDAGCIDAYNDPKHDDPDELHFHRNSALVRLRAEGVAGAANDEASAVIRGIGIGARLDVDLPIVALLSSAMTDTGLAVGFSGVTSFVADRSRSYAGELRLGIARRSYGVGWSSASGRCMRRRVDIGVDLLRWRLGAFTDLSVATHPTSLVSSVAFPGVVYRRMYPRWGFSLTAAFAEFRLAPSFEWGTNAGLEFYYRWAVLGLTVGAYFLPDPALTASIGLGIPFEL